MIKISKQNNSLIVEGIDNVFYPNNGDNSYPLNSLIVVTDNSDMATFRSVATNDVLFSGLIKDITINGEAVTKDNIIQKFDAVSNSSTGGGGGSTVDAYTKEEADNKFSTKDELSNVQTVANDADTKVDALTPRVESVETAMNDKQDLLVSGTNIKTINNQSILGEGNLEISGDVDLTNYYTKPEADGKFATITGFNEQAADISALQTSMDGKQATLVSGENIKTINSQSILGEGNIEVSGGIKIYEESEIPSVLLKELKEAVYGAKTKKDYSKYTTTDVTPISQFLSNLSYGDYLKFGKENTNRLQLIGNRKVGTEFYYYFNIIVADISYTKIYSNYITVTVLSSQIYVGNNKSVEVAKITDIPNTDNFASKDELTAVETALNNKQDTLVSGTNIKTVNSQSILGEGNLEVSGVSEEQAQEIAKIPTIETELAQKANASDVPTVQTDYNGTNKNYVYSDPNTSSTKVISNVTLVREFDRIRMQKYYWIPDDSTSANYVTDILSSATTSKAGVMSAADKTKLDSISNEWTGTQSEYDALTTKDNNTIYYVTE